MGERCVGWVVDCRNVGTGEPALEYLSRYLYRGVIGEPDLIDYDETTGTGRPLTLNRSH